MRSFVVGIPGQNRRVVSFECSEVVTACRIVAALALPFDGDRLSVVACGKLFAGEDELPAHVSRVDLHVSLCGGKGGFGALLRGGPGGLRTRKVQSYFFFFLVFFFFFFFFQKDNKFRCVSRFVWSAAASLQG
jgi:hypothetical protein